MSSLNLWEASFLWCAQKKTLVNDCILKLFDVILR